MDAPKDTLDPGWLLVSVINVQMQPSKTDGAALL